LPQPGSTARKSSGKFASAERESLAAEFRAIAARRLRLGLVVAEIARRSGLPSRQGADLENQVIDLLLTQARVEERPLRLAELQELIEA
jgi:hypothetical protein